ncbi:hypothetical protein T08_4955 [Trichinella sp. T8]|nr:hypothetical protein T08_4955 [Trichinella sp. T8]
MESGLQKTSVQSGKRAKRERTNGILLYFSLYIFVKSFRHEFHLCGSFLNFQISDSDMMGPVLSKMFSLVEFGRWKRPVDRIPLVVDVMVCALLQSEPTKMKESAYVLSPCRDTKPPNILFHH